MRCSRNGMRKLMQAPRGPDRNVTLGPVLNAFFGWGVLPRTEVTIGKVNLVSGENEGPATVGVNISYRGETHKVLVHVIMGDEGLGIANIIYDNGKSLIDISRNRGALNSYTRRPHPEERPQAASRRMAEGDIVASCFENAQLF